MAYIQIPDDVKSKEALELAKQLKDFDEKMRERVFAVQDELNSAIERDLGIAATEIPKNPPDRTRFIKGQLDSKLTEVIKTLKLNEEGIPLSDPGKEALVKEALDEKLKELKEGEEFEAVKKLSNDIKILDGIRSINDGKLNKVKDISGKIGNIAKQLFVSVGKTGEDLAGPEQISTALVVGTAATTTIPHELISPEFQKLYHDAVAKAENTKAEKDRKEGNELEEVIETKIENLSLNNKNANDRDKLKEFDAAYEDMMDVYSNLLKNTDNPEVAKVLIDYKYQSTLLDSAVNLSLEENQELSKKLDGIKCIWETKGFNSNPEKGNVLQSLKPILEAKTVQENFSEIMKNLINSSTKESLNVFLKEGINNLDPNEAKEVRVLINEKLVNDALDNSKKNNLRGSKGLLEKNLLMLKEKDPDQFNEYFKERGTQLETSVNEKKATQFTLTEKLKGLEQKLKEQKKNRADPSDIKTLKKNIKETKAALVEVKKELKSIEVKKKRLVKLEEKITKLSRNSSEKDNIPLDVTSKNFEETISKRSAEPEPKIPETNAPENLAKPGPGPGIPEFKWVIPVGATTKRAPVEIKKTENYVLAKKPTGPIMEPKKVSGEESAKIYAERQKKFIENFRKPTIKSEEVSAEPPENKILEPKAPDNPSKPGPGLPEFKAFAVVNKPAKPVTVEPTIETKEVPAEPAKTKIPESPDLPKTEKVSPIDTTKSAVVESKSIETVEAKKSAELDSVEDKMLKTPEPPENKIPETKAPENLAKPGPGIPEFKPVIPVGATTKRAPVEIKKTENYVLAKKPAGPIMEPKKVSAEESAKIYADMQKKFIDDFIEHHKNDALPNKGNSAPATGIPAFRRLDKGPGIS